MQLIIAKHNYLHISLFKTLFFLLGQFVARSSFGAFLRLSVSYFGISRSSFAVRLFSWFALGSLYAPCIHSRKISHIIVCGLFSASSWVRLTSSRISHGTGAELQSSRFSASRNDITSSTKFYTLSLCIYSNRIHTTERKF